jgi:hypothetical protein
MSTQPVVVRGYTPIRWILVIIAILLFLLAAFHANPFGASVDLIPLGLAFGFGALLVP